MFTKFYDYILKGIKEVNKINWTFIYLTLSELFLCIILTIIWLKTSFQRYKNNINKIYDCIKCNCICKQY